MKDSFPSICIPHTVNDISKNMTQHNEIYADMMIVLIVLILLQNIIAKMIYTKQFLFI